MLENPIAFGSADDSHRHSLETLNHLERYQDFMRSINTMCDMGCGEGYDLEWWATRTILDDEDNQVPLNINCTGIDLHHGLQIARLYKNVTYEHRDFEDPNIGNKRFDVIWCHDAFQYAINPFQTLKNFYNLLTPGGMLASAVPHNTNVIYHKQEFDQPDFQYYNYTLVSLIHILAVSGFECKTGFIKKEFEDPWIHAIVYKSEHEPMNPKNTSWWDLYERDLLPESAEQSLYKRGYLRQRDLVLPWLDRSMRDYGQI